MNNNEELEDEKCLACDLVEEFKRLVDDNVNWEEALSYVIHVAMDIKDDIIADLVDEQYTIGYEDGLTMGVEKASSLVNELVVHAKDEIVAYRAEREKELNGEVEEVEQESEEIEDISDEDFEEYAKIIREYQERNQ